MELLKKEDAAALAAYETFVQTHPNGCFMQSLRWSGVKANWRWEAVIARNSQGAISGTMLLLIKKLPMGRRCLLYAPRGPVCAYNDQDALSQLIAGARLVARQYGGLFLRTDPPISEEGGGTDWLTGLGFVQAKNQTTLNTVQPSVNYVLRVEGKTKEQLFSAFHSKWRYNIRLAERRGVQCRVCDVQGMDDFYPLLCETGARDHFTPRERSYYERMLESLGPHARLYLCYWNGIPLCGALCVCYGSWVTYLYGASSSLHREQMAGYLMQWNMICWAVDSGCSWYDFGGISYYQMPERAGYGVYRFKQGFSGQVVRYAGDFDLKLHRSAQLFLRLERIFRLGRRRLVHAHRALRKWFAGLSLFEKGGQPCYNRVHNTPGGRGMS